jgi:hypothetical protein
VLKSDVTQLHAVALDHDTPAGVVVVVVGTVVVVVGRVVVVVVVELVPEAAVI